MMYRRRFILFLSLFLLFVRGVLERLKRRLSELRMKPRRRKFSLLSARLDEGKTSIRVTGTLHTLFPAYCRLVYMDKKYRKQI